MFERCARCGAPAASLMTYSYGERQMWLEDLVSEVVPGTGYALCAGHSDRMAPPVGWSLTDLRGGQALFAPLEVA